MRIWRATVEVVVVAGLLVSCSDDGGERPAATAAATSAGALARDAAAERLDAISGAVERWWVAQTLPEAAAAAEEARNLVTGPAALGAGDLDGDGVVGGATDVGLLPGPDGTAGLASPLAGCPSVDADVLGGSWADAAGRWALLDKAIQRWTTRYNTFPALPSHPQRIVGWATLTIASSSLTAADDYAGHARLHVAVTRDALDSCA